MKEYTLITFLEDGTILCEYCTKKEIEGWLDEIGKESISFSNKNFLNEQDGNFYSESLNSDCKYLLIKGLPIVPKVVEKITKYSIIKL